jgi:hypothetical protein
MFSIIIEAGKHSLSSLLEEGVINLCSWMLLITSSKIWEALGLPVNLSPALDLSAPKSDSLTFWTAEVIDCLEVYMGVVFRMLDALLRLTGLLVLVVGSWLATAVSFAATSAGVIASGKVVIWE